MKRGIFYSIVAVYVVCSLSACHHGRKSDRSKTNESQSMVEYTATSPNSLSGKTLVLDYSQAELRELQEDWESDTYTLGPWRPFWQTIHETVFFVSQMRFKDNRYMSSYNNLELVFVYTKTGNTSARIDATLANDHSNCAYVLNFETSQSGTIACRCRYEGMDPDEEVRNIRFIIK